MLETAEAKREVGVASNKFGKSS